MKEQRARIDRLVLQIRILTSMERPLLFDLDSGEKVSNLDRVVQDEYQGANIENASDGPTDDEAVERGPPRRRSEGLSQTKITTISSTSWTIM